MPNPRARPSWPRAVPVALGLLLVTLPGRVAAEDFRIGPAAHGRLLDDPLLRASRGFRGGATLAVGYASADQPRVGPALGATLVLGHTWEVALGGLPPGTVDCAGQGDVVCAEVAHRVLAAMDEAETAGGQTLLHRWGTALEVGAELRGVLFLPVDTTPATATSPWEHTLGWYHGEALAVLGLSVLPWTAQVQHAVPAPTVRFVPRHLQRPGLLSFARLSLSVVGGAAYSDLRRARSTGGPADDSGVRAVVGGRLALAWPAPSLVVEARFFFGHEGGRAFGVRLERLASGLSVGMSVVQVGTSGFLLWELGWAW